MIASMKIELKATEDIKFNTNIGSLLHGYIIENLDPDFADEMHISQLRPFSQSISRNRDKKWIWQVNALTDKANDNIINMLASKESIYLRHKDTTLDISNFSVERTSFDEIFENNYLTDELNRYINIEFITPTAFKSNGRYINYPDLRLFFMSIINKYDANSQATQIYDERLIEELAMGVEIIKYNLRSTYFSLESVRIPAYWGSITIKLSCSATTVKLVNMLVDFAQYSGVGIKNALGMGGVVKLNNIRRGNNG